MAPDSIWPGMFQAEAGTDCTASVRSISDTTITTVRSYAICDTKAARKKAGQPATTAVEREVMRIKTIVVLVVAVTLASVHSAEAQQSNKIVRIGLISQSSPSAMSPQIESLLQGLRELGYLEGKNISFERRYAQGELDRLAALVGELLRTKVDVIVATSTPATLAAKKTTNEIPIVFHVINDPVETGIVDSLARPGGNLTGVTMGGAELYGKRLSFSRRRSPNFLGRRFC
jgi:putative ABC transport system substrate-binding protein